MPTPLPPAPRPTAATRPTGASPAAPSDRLLDVDALRVLAIGYLFPFHAARVFDASEAYYVEGTPHPVTTALVHASPWFMPLLFVLAGMAARFALRRRSPGAFARERVRRLGVPLLFGVVVLVPPQAYVGLVAHGGTSSPGAFLARYFADWSDLTGYRGTFTPGQLWFLAFLLVISLALAPVLGALTRRGWTPPWAGRPGRVWLVPVGLAVLSAAPTIGGKNLLVDAGYVLAGFALASEPTTLVALARRRHAHGAVAVVGLVAWVALLPRLADDVAPVTDVVVAVGRAAVVWASVLALLGHARRHLADGGPFARALPYLGTAAMPVYVLHQTVLVVVALGAVRLGGGVAVQYPVIVVGSMLGSLALYELLRRARPLRLLLGVKEPRP